MDTRITGACHTNQFECYSSKVYDDAVAKGDTEKDLTAALKDYAVAEKQFLTDAAEGLLYNRPVWMLVKPYVQGIADNPYEVRQVSFPGEHYSETIYISQH
jgi:hypothetical protein